MKYSLLFLVCIGLGFISCEGRKTQQQALKESIKTFKANTKLEQINYVPESYTQVEVDTLLVNGFRVKSTNFTEMDKSISKVTTSKAKTTKTFYRNWTTDLSITFNKNPVFLAQVNDAFLSTINSDQNIVDKEYYYSHLQLDQEKSLKDSVTINLFSRRLESDNYIVYEIEVQKNGTYTLESVSRI